jgi:DNA helicase II / ATP-dependent DNA helicase PcrA
MNLLKGLNPQQYEAASHVDGPLLILAGAGSGKTRVITHRIAHLIVDHGVPAWSILAVTFTNKAAEEMRQRISSILNKAGASGTPPTVATFHSFCVRLLRRDGAKLADIRPGFTNQFNIYDDDDQLAVIKSIFKALGLDEKFMQYRAALSRISHAKNHKETPQDFYKQSTDPKMSRLAVVYERYEERLRQANALDFDDLLLESVRLLYHDAETRKRYNERLRYLLIDEYQDTNRSQYELVRLLTQTHQNVCVVGDEDQSIYGWRGADIRNILDFERDYPNAKVIRLEQNYRSTKNILEAASAVVANNKERKGKWLWTDSGAGEKIFLYEALDAENEALFIADTIERTLHQNPDWKIAVLYRTNFQSRQIEEALRRYGRKYVVVGGFSFYQRSEIKDILSYLKVASAPQDSISMLRIINTPARGIGKTTVEQLEQFALNENLSIWSAMKRMLEEGQFGSRAETALAAFYRLIDELHSESHTRRVDELMRLLLDRTGYQKMLETDVTPEAESRMGNVSELLNAAAEAAERGESLSDFLDHAALVSDADSIDLEARVSLLTMHNAKGLEFPVVFLAGLEEGLFPHSRSLNSIAQMEEERRLCYVGMTRAEKKLYLSWARYRRRYGGGQPEATIASRFLAEVPRELMDRLSGADDIPQVDLTSERYEVRESARRNLYTGKTYNSLDNISQFFAERGIKPKTPVPPTPSPQRSPFGTQARSPLAEPPRQATPPSPPPRPESEDLPDWVLDGEPTSAISGRGPIVERRDYDDDERMALREDANRSDAPPFAPSPSTPPIVSAPRGAPASPSKPAWPPAPPRRGPVEPSKAPQPSARLPRRGVDENQTSLFGAPSAGEGAETPPWESISTKPAPQLFGGRPPSAAVPPSSAAPRTPSSASDDLPPWDTGSKPKAPMTPPPRPLSGPPTAARPPVAPLSRPVAQPPQSFGSRPPGPQNPGGPPASGTINSGPGVRPASGVPSPPRSVAPPSASPKPTAPKAPAGFRAGSVIYHAKYGKGTVMRREGDGDDAKLTVSFPGYGLKKIIEKYASLKRNE